MKNFVYLSGHPSTTKDYELERIFQAFEGSTTDRLTDTTSLLHFSSPAQIEELGVRYNECKIPELNNADIYPVRPQCVLCIKNCDYLDRELFRLHKISIFQVFENCVIIQLQEDAETREKFYINYQQNKILGENSSIDLDEDVQTLFNKIKYKRKAAQFQKILKQFQNQLQKLENFENIQAYIFSIQQENKNLSQQKQQLWNNNIERLRKTLVEFNAEILLLDNKKYLNQYSDILQKVRNNLNSFIYFEQNVAREMITRLPYLQQATNVLTNHISRYDKDVSKIIQQINNNFKDNFINQTNMSSNVTQAQMQEILFKQNPIQKQQIQSQITKQKKINISQEYLLGEQKITNSNLMNSQRRFNFQKIIQICVVIWFILIMNQ